MTVTCTQKQFFILETAQIQLHDYPTNFIFNFSKMFFFFKIFSFKNHILKIWGVPIEPIQSLLHIHTSRIPVWNRSPSTESVLGSRRVPCPTTDLSCWFCKWSRSKLFQWTRYDVLYTRRTPPSAAIRNPFIANPCVSGSSFIQIAMTPSLRGEN